MTKTPQIEAIPGMTPMGFTPRPKSIKVTLNGLTYFVIGDSAYVEKVKQGRYHPTTYLSKITSERKLKKLFKLAQNLALVGSPDVGAR